jgi:curved DNA-binding protein CbpA
MKDYYIILEVPVNADQETIKESYRKLARKWHPDMNMGNPLGLQIAEGNMKFINEAYDVLGNPEKKRKYDLERMGIAQLAWRIVPSWSATWGTSTATGNYGGGDLA